MDITSILEKFEVDFQSINNSKELQELKVKFLGRKGLITEQFRKINGLDLEEKKRLGLSINQLKNRILDQIELKANEFKDIELNHILKQDKIDVTIPISHEYTGGIHPITQCTEELLQIFSKYGFEVKYGPLIENEWYNFTALNMDENHPARQMHDTFYLKDKVLRTHTSNVQIRTMENQNPPFAFISPGKVYRSDYDDTHTPMFHQIECLFVDKNVNMGHLRYVIQDFIRIFFGSKKIKIRFRPSFFPFTEPSAEVDISMSDSKDNWLEILGCGMVHPQVLKNVNIDNNIYRGFAFGLGIERMAMLKYNISDLRQLFNSDIRWINDNKFSAFSSPNLFFDLK